MSGNTLAVFEHYGMNFPGWRDHPYNAELLCFLARKQPPPDEEHGWILVDPETMEEMETSIDMFCHQDTVYAVLKKKDREADRKKLAQWELNVKIRKAKAHPWPDPEPYSD